VFFFFFYTDKAESFQLHNVGGGKLDTIAERER